MAANTFTLTASQRSAIEAPLGPALVLAGPEAAAFAIISDTAEAVLNAGESRTVMVSFTPSGVGRFGAALVLTTEADAHPVAFGLAGRGVDAAYAPPLHTFTLAGPHAVMEVPSEFGTDYGLALTMDPGDPAPPVLFTVPGNGRTLYLVDPGVVDGMRRAFYRVRSERK